MRSLTISAGRATLDTPWKNDGTGGRLSSRPPPPKGEVQNLRPGLWAENRGSPSRASGEINPPLPVTRSPSPSRGCQPAPLARAFPMPRPPPRGPGRWGPWVHPGVHRCRKPRHSRTKRALPSHCKSAIVGSTPTGASCSKTLAKPRKHGGFSGVSSFSGLACHVLSTAAYSLVSTSRYFW